MYYLCRLIIFLLSACIEWFCHSGLVEDGYHQNPYHNAVHAADVTQAVNCFMLETKVG